MNQNVVFYKFVFGLIKPLMKIFYPYEVEGTENIDKLKSGYILCSNHLSNLDPIFLAITHPKPVCFMAKAELFRFKIFGRILNLLGAFSVKRGKNDKESISEAENILKSNKILGIFIEGTRSKTGNFLRPKSGVSVLSYSAKKPILPVCITGSSNNNKVKIFTKTKIKYGEPINYENLEIDSSHLLGFKRSAKYIMSKIEVLR